MQFTFAILNKEQTVISQNITSLTPREEKVWRSEGRGSGPVIPPVLQRLQTSWEFPKKRPVLQAETGL